MKATKDVTMSGMREIVCLFEKENSKLRRRLVIESQGKDVKKAKKDAREQREKYLQESAEVRKLRAEKDEIVNRMEALLNEVKSVRTVI